MMRASSLRRLSPLLLLAAALVASAVFFLHDGQPAAAQSADIIWSATLDLLSNSDSCNEDPITPGTIECSLLLTDNEFTIGDVVYQVTRVDTDPGPQGTRIVFNKAIPANLKSSLTFHVNNRALALADATLANSDKAAIWSNVRSLWSQGDDLSLRLTGQTFTPTVWIATLDLPSNSDSCDENPITPGTIECSLLLTDNEFTIGGEVYQVTRVDTDPAHQGTRIVFNKAIPANLKSSLTFHVNNRALALADATLANSDKTAIWSNVRSLWSQGDDLSLRLTIRDPATVWIATLDLPSNSDSCDENPITPGTIECSLLLTDNEFTIGGEVYQVTRVDTDPAHQGTRIVFNKAIPANLKSSLTFHVNNRALALADATLANSDKTAIWSNVRSLWSQGDDLSLRLTGASSSDTALSDLTAESSQDGSTFVALTLSPDFATAITSYSAGVGGIVTHARLTPTFSHGTSWVLVNGQAVASGSPSAAIALAMGANTITVRVTAENGSAQDYTVTVHKLTAARLSNLEVLDEYGSLLMRPAAFDGSWPEQTQVIFVAPGIRRVKIKPHWPEASSITVTVSTSDMTLKNITYSTATVSTSGAESDFLRISDSGGTKLNITVTEGSDTTEYGSKYVTRELDAANADNYLNSMGVSPNPNARASFSGWGNPGYYNVLHREPGPAGGLNWNIAYQSVGPLTSWWQPASGYPRILPSDPYTPVAGLPQQNAGSITLTPAFDPYVQEYTATVPHEVSSVFVNLSLSHPKASATVNGNSLSTPVSLEVGENVVEVVVTAESGVQRTYTLTITREFPNRPPAVASAIVDATIINESGTLQVSLSDVFSDPDGDDLTITANSSGDSVATASVSADHSTLTVTAKGRGTAVIGVNAADGRGGEIWDLLFVKVKAAPVVASAIADVSELEVEATHDVSLSEVFSDADGDALNITAASSDDGKVTVAVAADQSRLTVAGVAEGTATITVTARDADGNSVSDTFGVSVAGPANAAPTVSTAVADATIVNESGTSQVSLSGVFADSDGDDLTVTASSSDENVATVSVASDYSTLTVSAQGRGTATVTVTANDGKGGSAEDSFSVSVKAAPVVASAIADVSELEVEATHEVSMSGVFSDPDGDAVTVTQASSSDSSIAAVSVTTNAVTVTARAEGTATITVTAQDADGNTVSDAFDVTVNAPAAQQQKVNNPPTVSGAIADATIVSESGTRQVSLSGVFDDADGDDLTVTASSSDENTATVSVPADYSTLTVTAQAGGTATITVTAADGYGGSVEDSFTVRVKAAPVVASAISDVSALEEGSTRDVSLSGAFSDADGDSLAVTAASSDEGKATVSVAADGSKLTVTGVAEGTATITVTARDADGNTVSDAFQVEVVQVPEPEPEPVELPGPVLGLELTATHDSVGVSWSAPETGDAPDGYIVNIKRQGGGDGETRRPGAGKTALTFRDLNGGSTYKVWVRAQNEAGKGERTHATITLPVELPGPVTGLEVAATGDGVTVSWSAPETGGAPDGYIVHVRPEGGAEGSGRTRTPRAKKTRVSFDNLESGRTYQVWVRAENESGKGERVHASITLPEAEPEPEQQDQGEPEEGQQQEGQSGQ